MNYYRTVYLSFKITLVHYHVTIKYKSLRPLILLIYAFKINLTENQSVSPDTRERNK